MNKELNDNNQDWQLIETAPKDGTSILLCAKGYTYVDTGYFDDFSEEWHMNGGLSMKPQPTHWKQLPPPIK